MSRFAFILSFLMTLGGFMNSTTFGAETDDHFLNLFRQPDAVAAVTESKTVELKNTEPSQWSGDGIAVTTEATSASVHVELSSPKSPVKYLSLRWNEKTPSGEWRYLGDAWERGYGNLEWKPLDSKREMPWYFLASNKKYTHGYGVMTAPAAFCHWTADADGVALTLDVRNGSRGVQLGKRKLIVCNVVCHRGDGKETPFAVAHAFCGVMCPKPRLPKQPVYGFNDWYCDYGKNSKESVLEYAKFVVRLSPKGENRPFMVIDDGWQPGGGGGGGGPWDRCGSNFSSMVETAVTIKKAGARPGIWIRLMSHYKDIPQSWKIENKGIGLDISKPEVREYVKNSVAQLRAWGYEMIKHDYSSFDLGDGWNKKPASDPNANWSFADRSRTTAEIILDHYQSIREGAGDDCLVIGCNTFNHLSAGYFELQRIGDDTSGMEWERVRKMGVNSLAFRGPQHDKFFAADADCVGLTEPNAIPWKLDRQWLDLLARSGTPLFVSFKKGSVTPEQEKEIVAALEIASKPQPLGEPLDWFDTVQPRRWKFGEKIVEYDWSDTK
jgi:alpha-galactosidase